MTTPTQWIEILGADIHWKSAYPQVERITREFLTERLMTAALKPGATIAAEGMTLSTNDLVQNLFPKELERGEGITARKRLYRALMTLANDELADCCHRSDPVKGKFGVTQRPWRWHAPREPHAEAADTKRARGKLVVCMHCGKETPA